MRLPGFLSQLSHIFLINFVKVKNNIQWCGKKKMMLGKEWKKVVTLVTGFSKTKGSVSLLWTGCFEGWYTGKKVAGQVSDCGLSCVTFCFGGPVHKKEVSRGSFKLWTFCCVYSQMSCDAREAVLSLVKSFRVSFYGFYRSVWFRGILVDETGMWGDWVTLSVFCEKIFRKESLSWFRVTHEKPF